MKRTWDVNFDPYFFLNFEFGFDVENFMGCNCAFNVIPKVY